MITPLYTALATLLFLILSIQTIRLRRKLGIANGTDGNQNLSKAISAHSNFAEYAPLAFLLIYFLEVSNGNSIYIHLLCTSLILGRLLHAWGISQIEENFNFRVIGMILTIGCLFSASITLIAIFLN